MSESSPRPDAIVDPRFCVSYPIDLTFFIDAAWLNCHRLAVTDTDGNVVFKVEADKCSLRSRQVVVDASGEPVISMQQKLRSVHDRWQVFKGDSSDAKDLLFSVRRSSALQLKTELDVFLAANAEEEACDFKMKGSYRKRSCAMSKEYKFANSSVSKDAFGFAAASGAIVGPRFCVPHPMDLTFFIDAAWLNCDRLAVTDINGNVVFKVEARQWSLRSRQVVVDASGKPVISMRQKLSSVHDRWQVFEGKSSDPKHLLFSVKRSSALQFKTELDVFLAANTKEEVCDFKIKGSFRKRSCTVYKGDSSTVVAQMSKEYKSVNGLVSKDAFGVAVNPNADYAFIAALAIIRHDFFKEDTAISGLISYVFSAEISDKIADVFFAGIRAGILYVLGGS
ncbi:hypothetical protein MUK42_02614 [Musa troglodytarum]|uniref:Protein LURP-one-related 15 n=1 Tax=Musa troglodytarum TaxID=320322 RepID=A0A9E7ERC1_9LILI|nr:hypothetical protein MUK42_02614 [Musa troglodytarum]